jgi:hypothetical protein
MALDDLLVRPPVVLEAILHDSEQCGFTMASDPKTGALLRALAAGLDS